MKATAITAAAIAEATMKLFFARTIPVHQRTYCTGNRHVRSSYFWLAGAAYSSTCPSAISRVRNFS